MGDNNRVNKFTKTNFTDYTSFGYSESLITDFAIDDEFIYVGDRQSSYSYMRKISKSTSTQVGTSLEIYNQNFNTVEADLEHVYGSTETTTYKYLKSDMSLVGTTIPFT